MMNANTKGTLFVKGDRINDRINAYAEITLKELDALGKKQLTIQDFKDFVKGVHIIIDTELGERGVERVWKA